MHKKIRPLFALLILNFYCNCTFSQNYKYLNADGGYENLDHDIYCNGINTVLDVNYTSFGKQKNLQASTCDYDLKNLKTKDISSIGKNIYRFSFFHKEKLYFFCTDKNESLYKYEIDIKDFSIIGSPEKIFSYENDVTAYATAYSQDSSFFSIICRHHNKKDENEIFDGIVFDQTLSEVTKFSFINKGSLDNLVDSKYLVSNQGILNIICQFQEKAKKKNDKESPYYNVTIISKDGKAQSGSQLSGFLSGNLQSIHWYLNADKLLFNGLSGELEKKGYNSIISGNYNYENNNIDNLKINEFSKSSYAAQASERSSKEIIENGLPSNVFLKGAEILKDNSTLLIYDLQANRAIGQYSAPGQSTIYNRSIDHFYGRASYIIKLNTKNEIEWFHAIEKKQEEASAQRFTGINYATDDRNGIYIFFHDNINNTQVFPKGEADLANFGNINKNSLAVVHITSSGKISKKFLWDNDDVEYKMLPGTSYSLKNNELIFIGYKIKAIRKYCTIAKITIDQ